MPAIANTDHSVNCGEMSGCDFSAKTKGEIAAEQIRAYWTTTKYHLNTIRGLWAKYLTRTNTYSHHICIRLMGFRRVPIWSYGKDSTAATSNMRSEVAVITAACTCITRAIIVIDFQSVLYQNGHTWVGTRSRHFPLEKSQMDILTKSCWNQLEFEAMSERLWWLQ